MKKTVCLLFACLFALLAGGCRAAGPAEDKTAQARINIGKSTLFSEADRDAAVQFILEKVRADGSIAKLNAVRYAGDEKSKKEAAYDRGYEEIIVFYIDFHTAKGADAEGFNADEDYTDFQQMLGRNAGGAWEYVDGGYA
ncbi:MAG: hypothetical protein IKD72_07620 [Clostridia bacterium]|nr:hypothetical protein [Clostridia bacterium]